MFILASSVCKSLQCLISTLTQGGKGGHLFRLTGSVVVWGRRNTATKSLACVGSARSLGHSGFAPAHGVCAFPVYIAQVPGCSACELSKAGPGLRALPRSKPLRFRFSSTPQRHRLGWACVLCPSQVLGEHTLLRRCVHLITSLVPATPFPGWQRVCLFWGADRWLWPSQQMSTVQNPRKS